MAVRKFEIEVTHHVAVEIDDSIIDEKFMSDFREYMYDFEELEDHAKHIAQMEARGLIGFDNFVEGYGDIRQRKISVKTGCVEIDCTEDNG